MIVFDTIRGNLATLGVELYHPGRLFLSQLGRIKFLILHLSNFVSFTIYACYETNDFLEYINTIFLASIQCFAFLAVFNCIWSAKDIQRLLNNIERTTEARSVNATSKTIYTGTDKKLQYFSKMMDLVILETTLICCTVPIFVVSMIKYFTTNLGEEAFDLPFHQWYPFDWKNPIGYGIAMAFEFLSGWCTFFVALAILKFAIGIYLFVFSMVEDIKCDLESINRNAKFKKTRVEVVQQFSGIVQFHSKVMQLSNSFSGVAKFMHALAFGWSLAAICSSMMLLQIQIERNEDNAALMILLVTELVWSFTLIFVICELGERASLAFMEMDHMVNQFSSYNFPATVKKLLPIFMAVISTSFRMSVFGSLTCGRESFKMVTNTGFSYFMVLRRFRS